MQAETLTSQRKELPHYNHHQKQKTYEEMKKKLRIKVKLILEVLHTIYIFFILFY
jgi:predicted component of type VI protein secretion system